MVPTKHARRVQLTYDKSGSRLVSCEADKSIKMFKEDDTAVCGLFGVEMTALLLSQLVRVHAVSLISRPAPCSQTEESHPVVWRPELRKKKF